MLDKLGVAEYQWLDVTLVKIVAGKETKIETLKTPIAFTMEVPEAMRAANRTYYLTTVHDGKASKVASGTDATLTGEFDRFSTYVLAYKDAEANPAPEPDSETDKNPGKNPEKTPDQDDEKTIPQRDTTIRPTPPPKQSATPNTADSIPAYLVPFLAVMALVACGILLKAKHMRKWQAHAQVAKRMRK